MLGEEKNTELSRLEERICHRFQHRELLIEAMTHSSFSHESKGDKKPPCNERMEFLGDSVLSLVVSEYIYEKYPDCPEGDLTTMRSALVRGNTASCFASEIGIGECLFLGNGEERSGGRENKKILEDAFEALVAAVYLDAGAGEEGMDAVRKYVLPLAEEKLSGNKCVIDYKTQLQEVVQRESKKKEQLEYVKTGEEGPDHAKVFTVEARVNSNVFGTGKGRRLRDAEQMAAYEALRTMGVLPDSDKE